MAKQPRLNLNLDSRLISVFVEMCELRSVSRTAERLDLAQSTVSLDLSKLRDLYQDRLFVRTTDGMVPTPRSMELLPVLAEANRLIQLSQQLPAQFDPITSTRRFSLCMSDAGQTIIVPPLLAGLRHQAPSVHIKTPPIWGDLEQKLESGQGDIAIGYIPDLETGIMRQGLYVEHYLCCVANRHPRLQSGCGINDFMREEHIVISPSGPGRQVLQTELSHLGIERKVGIELSSYSAVASVLDATDFIAVLPSRLANCVSALIGARLFTLPVQSPTYTVSQHWHQRFSADPGNQWLRGLLAEIFHAESL